MLAKVLASNLGHPQNFKPSEERPEISGKVLTHSEIIQNTLRQPRTLLEVVLSQFEVKIGDLSQKNTKEFSATIFSSFSQRSVSNDFSS